MTQSRAPRRVWPLLLLLVGLAVWFAARAGSFLIVDEPRKSDLILVLAGETNKRPEHALELLAQGYGRTMLLDVQADSKIYETSEKQLAQKYIDDLHGTPVSICSIEGLSTKAESKDEENCIARAGARSVLIVTSDYHTRRALSTFRKEIPGIDFSVAAARDDAQFGARWWSRRQWAKTFVDEWLRLIWWKSIDQWR